jgi:UDP-N-acetylglucosamine 2-epimerase
VDWKILGTAADSGIYLSELGTLLAELWLRRKPDWVLNFGHCGKSFSTTMTAFQNNIPSINIYDSMRANAHRKTESHFSPALKSVAIVSELLFAPSVDSRNILIQEGINEKSVYVVGNTLTESAQLIFEKFTTENFTKRLSRAVSDTDLRSLIERRYCVIHAESEDNLKLRAPLIARLCREQQSILPVILIQDASSGRRTDAVPDCFPPEAIILHKLNYLQKMALLRRAVCVTASHADTIEECAAVGTRSLVLDQAVLSPEFLSSDLVSALPQQADLQFRAIVSCAENLMRPVKDEKIKQIPASSDSPAFRIVRTISSRTNETSQKWKTSLLSRQAV